MNNGIDSRIYFEVCNTEFKIVTLISIYLKLRLNKHVKLNNTVFKTMDMCVVIYKKPIQRHSFPESFT